MAVIYVNAWRSMGRSGLRIEMKQGVARVGTGWESGITHRDIKPENIMRSSLRGRKVADFGLARIQTDMSMTQNQPNSGRSDAWNVAL